MGDSFNYLIDSISSAFMRLFELPVFVLIIGVLVTYFIITFLFSKFRKKKFKLDKNTLLIVLFICTIFIIDKKISFLASEVNQASERFNQNVLTSSITSSNNGDNFVDESKLLSVLGKKELVVQSRKTNPATQLLLISKTSTPLAKAYIAVVDLTYPTLQIHLSDNIKQKTLTTEFAKKYNCNIAVNGEAGESMSMDAALGEWTGNYIINGKPVLLEDSDKRPFISFSQNNKGKYFKESIVDTTVNAEKYNTIWGRFDILLEGEIPELEEERPYPRTILGLNNTGDKLYIMVVDGKKPNYSLGLSYQQCAKMLKSIGAYNVMSCDQGGSSCMYVKEVNGLISRPADSEGIERPIYTHFGVSIK